MIAVVVAKYMHNDGNNYLQTALISQMLNYKHPHIPLCWKTKNSQQHLPIRWGKK